MPNYCECELNISGKPDEIKRFLEHAKTDEYILDANKFIPYPDKFKEMDEKYNEAIRKFKSLSKEEQIEYQKEHKNPCFEKDGVNSGGYEWRIENWGTKWGLGEPTLVDENTYRQDKPDETKTVEFEFDTAWSPPIPVIKKMGEMFPKLEFILRYFECGMEFNGKIEIKDGKTVSEEEGQYFGHRGG